MHSVHVRKLREDAIVPTYGSTEAAGADLYACLSVDVVIEPGQSAFLPTGLAMEIPKGYVGLICARSGMACKKGLAPANKVGVIDSDYRGELIVVLYNHGNTAQTVSARDRIAQLLIVPVLTPTFMECDELKDTSRADGGFGSTGI